MKRTAAPVNAGRSLRRLLRFVPAAAWAALIFWLSSQPKLPDMPVFFPGIDKLHHAVAYGVLTLLLLFGAGMPRDAKTWWLVGAAVAYGATDELHQAFVPGREPDILDLLADALGALLVNAVWLRRARGAAQEKP